MLSPELARAQLLLAQGRPAEAETEARHALASNPHDPDALIVLAACLEAQKKYEAAI